MKFIYGKNDWSTIERGEENCYLLTNGLGGFSSLTMIGSNARNDHALLMACLKAPNNRYNIISNLGERLKIKDNFFDFSSQRYLNTNLDRVGFKYQSKFIFEDVPEWTYHIEGVEITKKIAMKQNENTVAVTYKVNNYTKFESEIEVIPYMEFVKKGEKLSLNQRFKSSEKEIKSNGIVLNYETNGIVSLYSTKYEENLFFSHDERDGREKLGNVAHNHKIYFKTKAKESKEFYIIYSTEEIKDSAEEIIAGAIDYRKGLVEKANIKDDIANVLVKSANQFIVNRESTKGKSIIAGYPFFEDWGRDTMIALSGCCIATKQFEDAKSIFRTFIHYCKNGIMPNIFPEGENEAMYNTVDASLLFINTVYEYYKNSNDIEFIKEAYPVMQDIINFYMNGTDFDINMDKDGLIKAGSGYDQVTWMDVRIDNILPTPRHGKPVEINAYWYSSLMIMNELSKIIGKEVEEYKGLAKLVKESFLREFWNEEKHCLKDVISGLQSDTQIRCNQIWAVSMPFTMLDKEKEKQIVETVFEKLYTPYGLRTLSMDDKEFKGFYGGEQLNRDLAYHQGTTWVFPLGAYYIAYLKVNDYAKEAINIVKSQLEVMESCLREGCVGQLPEIYDGENPTISKGCFAQAWSVAEILRVYEVIDDRMRIR
ncbi:MAG: glycogen debranching protein [Clostridium butyricum]|nr:glycogen debranching protein [Clostridium butyricum]